MNRSGYTDDVDLWPLIRWRGQVASAMRGKRGQAFLLEMWKAMQALPEPKLISDELEKDGAVCALGSVGKARGVDMTGVDAHDYKTVAAFFAIPRQLAQEIMFMNDEACPHVTPENRFKLVKDWIEENLLPVAED